MTPIEKFLDLLINIQIWSVVKLFILFALGLYLVFAYMVIREVNLMSRTIQGVFNLPIKIIAWLNLLLAVLVFIFSLVVL